MSHYRCGHPKNSENSWSLGNGWTRCKRCHQARKKSGRRLSGDTTPEEAKRVRELLAEGKSQRAIAALVGVSSATVFRIKAGHVKRFSNPVTSVRLVAFAPLPLPPRADESPEINGGRSYSFPPKRRSA